MADELEVVTIKPSASNSRFTVAKVSYSPSHKAEETSDNSNNGLKFTLGDPDVPTDEVQDDPESSSSHPTDTKSYKTNTNEALPHEDHYRNLFSATHHLRARPTLEELHGSSVENLFIVNEDLENGHSTPELHDFEEVVIDTKKNKLKFGWIKGVLVRCLLNIWGVMLFLRLPWIVGQAGIGHTTIIILLATVVTTITAISMSAICTNGVVKGGGTYYLISRSLGPEFGASIGIVFALANAVAVALYLVGFAETVRDVMYVHGAKIVDELNDLRIIALLCLVLCVIIVVIGMEWEARAQVVLLFILLIAIADFFIGTFIPPTEDKLAKGFYGWRGHLFVENFSPAYTEGESFFSIFAVFFPAATGILAGANISGDLKDPQSAIPKGTLLAILITTMSYLAIAWGSGFCAVRHAAGVVVAQVAANLSDVAESIVRSSAVNTQAYLVDGVTDGDGNYDFSAQVEANNNLCRTMRNCTFGLLDNFQMIEMMSAFGPLVTAGIFAATLSSALTSFVSGPKVFQAVCRDRIFSFIHAMGKGYGKNNEPLRSYALCFVIAAGFIAIGELNVIALFISNFFLMAYALVNYSCFDASLAKSPGWRPSFRYYSMWLSLAGFLLCVIVMFVIMWWIALCTFLLVGVLYVYVHYSKPDVNWGSSMQAHVYRNALQSTQKLVRVMDHIKNYRPQILVLTGFPSQRPALLDFAHAITKKQSLLACGHVLLSDRANGMKHVDAYVSKANTLLEKRKSKAFYNVVTAPTFRLGAQSMLQSVGIGKLRPNTIVMGFKSDWRQASAEDIQEYVNVVHDAFDLRYGVGILRVPEGFNRGDVDEEHNDEGEERLPYNESFVDASVLGDTTRLPEEVGSSNHLDVPTLKQRKRFRLRKPQSEIPSRFSAKQPKGTIDVYWLFDDGGLTILLPYIISTRKMWSDSKLRVFSAGSDHQQLDSDQRHMASLLSKFRIDYSSVTILCDMGDAPDATNRENFDRLIEDYMLNEEMGETSDTHPWKISKGDLKNCQGKTNRHIRLKEILLEKSATANLIVLTLPMPRKNLVPASLYLAWIETLTSDLPPILLLRGNQQSVLTYYS